jgi:hypothetical protein
LIGDLLSLKPGRQVIGSDLIGFRDGPGMPLEFSRVGGEEVALNVHHPEFCLEPEGLRVSGFLERAGGNGQSSTFDPVDVLFVPRGYRPPTERELRILDLDV